MKINILSVCIHQSLRVAAVTGLSACYVSASHCAELKLKMSTQLSLAAAPSPTYHAQIPFDVNAKTFDPQMIALRSTNKNALQLEIGVWPPFESSERPSQQVNEMQTAASPNVTSRIGFVPNGMSYALTDDTSIQYMGTSSYTNADKIWQTVRLTKKDSDARQWFFGVNKSESTSKDEITAGIGVLLNLK